MSNKSKNEKKSIASMNSVKQIVNEKIPENQISNQNLMKEGI